MRYKSLKTRLILIFLLVGIIPVFATVSYNYFAAFNSFEEVQYSQQNEMEHSVTKYFEQTASDLQYLVELYAKDPEIQQLLLEEDRTLIKSGGEALFNKLSAQHKLAIFEIGDEKGAVHVRGHNPSAYGDDKSEIVAIQGALQGNTYSGFEYGTSGLAVRAFAPIEWNGRTIGTLQIGVGNEFVTSVQSLFPNAKLQLIDANGEIFEASEKENIGSKLTGNAISAILNGEASQLKNQDKKVIESFLPLQDPTATTVIGGIHLTQNIGKTQSAMFSMINGGAVILIITIILAIAVALTYSRTLTKPIIHTSKLLHVLSEGDLTQRMEAHNRQDEIGQLMTDMKIMQENLHRMIGEVSKASSSVNSKSAMLALSTSDVSTGSQAIAETMETLSRGIELQTNEITEVYEAVNKFSNDLKETAEQGTRLESVSGNVLLLSSEGTKMMQTSNGQMQEIHNIMDTAIHKMEELGERVGKITSFVNIIEDVANQTNLLALNASIEAARAGEHGKGFAVVAEEVRKLAEQVAKSVTEISAIVTTIQHGSNELSSSLQQGFTTIETGTDQLSNTADTFKEIEQSVLQMDAFTKQVLGQLQTMSNKGQEINQSMQEISAITEETTASVEETTATVIETSATMNNVAETTEQLAELADQLNQIVKEYKI
ncbi:methyl-accepting chemotaxis protein [Solibacillus sp. A46]|uniref:Methyl-accepting chemotaxis protein n=1 Tax=Solibacillus faecavium TaxID=2762221 RepID=A0ABR8Y247_9BACL|nr:methyl-accepting chemotaxis protein [Solibacillus faecavium]MBD8038139.1 methyl-accepting chemotaxis protein [Solibacillus faecavium]